MILAEVSLLVVLVGVCLFAAVVILAFGVELVRAIRWQPPAPPVVVTARPATWYPRTLPAFDTAQQDAITAEIDSWEPLYQDWPLYEEICR